MNEGRLADNLRVKGYDLVILNFPKYEIGNRRNPDPNISIPIKRDGGADYIERNARVLMALINKVNAEKIGNEKLVIIGPSMGGLISRYALAYMEKNNMPHNTRLWVSFDSPHQGANIPVGDQYFLDYFAKMTQNEAIIENRDEKISSVAAKQMLVHHYKANSTLPQGAPAFRDRFKQTLDELGFPAGDPGQPFRKIALVDGSLGGTEIYSPCEKGFTMDIRSYNSLNLWLFKIKYKTFSAYSAK